MTHVFRFLVEVEVERRSGKFVARDNIATEIADTIIYADPGLIDVEESEYQTISWTVDDVSRIAKATEAKP